MTEDSITHPEDKNQLITLPEAAEMYGFTANYLGQLARRGRLEAKKYGVFWLTTPRAMEEFIETRRVTGFYKENIDLDNS